VDKENEGSEGFFVGSYCFRTFDSNAFIVAMRSANCCSQNLFLPNLRISHFLVNAGNRIRG